jgi:hypothetical protein
MNGGGRAGLSAGSELMHKFLVASPIQNEIWAVLPKATAIHAIPKFTVAYFYNLNKYL